MRNGRPTTRQEGDLCVECGIEPIRFKGYTASGNPRYDKYCGSCHRGNYSMPWLKHRGDSCEACDHRPFFKSSLDVHHRDGDKNNNDPDNLMTLCPGCHRDLHSFGHQTGDLRKAENLLKKFIKSMFG